LNENRAWERLAWVAFIWLSFADDTEITLFLKRAPWGTEPDYSVTVERMQTKLKDYLPFLKQESDKNG